MQRERDSFLHLHLHIYIIDISQISYSNWVKLNLKLVIIIQYNTRM